MTIILILVIVAIGLVSTLTLEEDAWLGASAIFASIVLGVYFSSWYYFGAALLVLLVIGNIPSISKLVVVLFSGMWGFAGYIIASTISEEAGIVVGAILLIGGLSRLYKGGVAGDDDTAGTDKGEP